MHRRLPGLRGMAWSAAAVLYTDRTASNLSRLFRFDRQGRTATNSKIIYHYLRGECEPTPGPRGKYRHDLTGAVHMLPGGAIARLWLNSPLWELLEGNLSAERARSIQSWIEESQPAMPILEYIHAWVRYRLVTLEQAPSTEQQERASAIARLHGVLKSIDPVFNYINGPLTRYLLEHEPQIPLARPPAKSRRKSPLATKIEKGIERSKRRWIRFRDGTQRYLRSGRLPDRRFLKAFAGPWDTFLRLNIGRDAALAEAKEFRRPKAGWELLCISWNIPIRGDGFSIRLGSLNER